MPDIGGALTRKIGPLPAWGWGVAVGGAFLAVSKLGGGGTKAAQPPAVVPTEYDDSFGPTVGFQEGLSNQLFDVKNGLDDLTNIVARQTQNNAPQVSQNEPNPVKQTVRSMKLNIFGKNLVYGGAKGLAEKYPWLYKRYAARNDPGNTYASRRKYYSRLQTVLQERSDRVSAK